MDETVKTEAFTRRKLLSLLAMGTMIGLGLATTGSESEAQTAGMKRRQARRAGRHKRREERRTARHKRRQQRRQ